VFDGVDFAVDDLGAASVDGEVEPSWMMSAMLLPIM
jgi:hypothetical protein